MHAEIDDEGRDNQKLMMRSRESTMVDRSKAYLIQVVGEVGAEDDAARQADQNRWKLYMPTDMIHNL